MWSTAVIILLLLVIIILLMSQFVKRNNVASSHASSREDTQDEALIAAKKERVRVYITRILEKALAEKSPTTALIHAECALAMANLVSDEQLVPLDPQLLENCAATRDAIANVNPPEIFRAV